MDKHLTKKLLAAEGLPTPVRDLFDLTGGTLPLLPGSLNLPLVIKPRLRRLVGRCRNRARRTKSGRRAMPDASKSYAQILAENTSKVASSRARRWRRGPTRSSKSLRIGTASIL